MKKMIYAVKSGRKTGIFNEWVKCFEQTNKCSNSKFRRFEYRSELAEEPEDVAGSLRYAIKEAVEYLKDLVYLGESADYLADKSWEEDGFLPFGDASKADEPEPYSEPIEEEEENDFEEEGNDFEEEGDDFEDEYGELLDDDRDTPDEPVEYWKIAQEMKEYVNIIRTNKRMHAKRKAASKLKEKLEECIQDAALSDLTAVYRDKKAENVIGYNPPAVAQFIGKLANRYPKPKVVEMKKVEIEGSLRQIFMQAGAIETELKGLIRGQDAAIEKLSDAYFNTEAHSASDRRGPRSVYLLAGPPGVGKTFMAENFATKLGFDYQKFDMSGYSNKEAIQELVGFAPTWTDSEPGRLTDFVFDHPKCVLLFDEIEKAHITVIRLFLQILNDGICEDKHNKRNVSFKDTIIFFTTNAGKQLYSDAQDENLTLLPDKVVIDALEKDKDSETGQQFFPPEILSRMSSHTIIMMNHLKADAILELVKNDIEKLFKELTDKYGHELSQGKEYLARIVLYSIGGSADARNASKMAGKFVYRELRKFLELLEDKQMLDESDEGRRIEWKCDFEDTTEEIRDFYFGEKNCVIPVFGTVEYEPIGRIKENNVRVEHTVDIDWFIEMLHKENVLFAVIDYIHGLENVDNELNVVDAKTIGRDVLLKLQEEEKEVPVYILDGSRGHKYTYKEKKALMKKGAAGFIERQYLESQLEQTYMDICCQVVMKTLTARHQILTYETKQEFNEKTNVGSIIFCDFKLKTAMESEDKSAILSDAERPNIKFDDVIGAQKAKEELRYFVKYLQKPREFLMKGVRPPKGILLYGSPGTGKTMLARAMAGESDVSFFQTSATEFKNKYIGESEANIRRIFAKAKKYAPAIIFIDEIDAIGKKRTGSENTHTEESMLNALLTEMDGFRGVDSNKPVFVLAATNYGVGGENDGIDSLDAALLRRFDNRIHVDLPKESEREQYLFKMLAKQNITTVSEETAHSIAERTTGQSLADIQNIFEFALRNAAKQSGTMTDDNLLAAFKEYNSMPSDAERPNIKFNDVIGAEKAKEELRYFVKYLTEPKEFLMKGGRPPKGILLYGRPGTGKTMLARAMAGESDVTFFQTSATEFMSSHVGESEANIRRIFAKARKYAPSIIFIDEIDAIGKRRTGSENTHHTESMLNALLTEMDGFLGTDSNKPVFVLAATNYGAGEERDGIAPLDEALLRRFDNKIYVDLPKESERERYLLLLLDGKNITTVSKDAVKNIAERTTGQSLSILQNVFELAFRNAAKQSRTMTDDDLLTAFEEYQYGEKKEYSPDYYKSVAIHETGHAYVSYISGDKPSYITIESRGNYGGYMQHANHEDVASYTREELLARIRISLAGRAAEEVFYGKAKSLNTGASSDLKHATDIAFQMVCTYGMEEDQLVTLGKDEVFQSALVGEYTAKVNEILKTEMKNTITTIENAKDKIQAIADVLARENRLTGKQFEELMEADGQ